MYGLLSTSKKKDIGVEFIQPYITKKALITIIVPSTPDGQGQGFAEIQEFPDFGCEEEVLFNIRWRFTVLEAKIEEKDRVKYRHLILLYGYQRIKRYLKMQDPVIKVAVGENPTDHCSLCKSPIRIDQDSLNFVNLLDSKQHVCYNCIKSKKCSHIPALVSVSRYINIEIKGILTPYKDKLDIAFYGYFANTTYQ